MIAIPAVDLRDGACVQLVGGSFDDERIRLPEPLAVARRWKEAGFRHLHVVDLDAAKGQRTNTDVVTAILALGDAKVGVGGGVRSSDDVARLLDAGASHVVVGTRAIDDATWLADVTAQFPGRVVVAADVRERAVVTHAWTRRLELDVLWFVAQLDTLELGGILVTAVHVEGLMQGPDLRLIEDVVNATRHPVTTSGGITTIDDLRALQSRGAHACVIGMALYSGALDGNAVAEEFNE
jgi:phosphoribosylformimino-5-aminoimidazole carboxamide ribotide isomerase